MELTSDFPADVRQTVRPKKRYLKKRGHKK